MTCDATQTMPHPARPTDRRTGQVVRELACILLLLVAVQVAAGPRMRLAQWDVHARNNPGVAEGVAWMSGRLDIPPLGPDPLKDRQHDTAFLDGRVYNVFPPLMPLLTVATAPLTRWLGGTIDHWLPWVFTGLFFWPLPIAGFLVFRRQSGDAAWAALLTFSWMCATPVLPNLYFACGGGLGQINHLASQVGLFLLAADVLGRQRIWPGLIGLAISTWSRQMTSLYALPLLWAAWRRGRVGLCVAGLASIAAPLLVLNQLKFGSPFEFGYRYMYAGREQEDVAQRCLTHGLLSPRFMPMNLWYMNLRSPSVAWGLTGLQVNPDQNGASMWVSTPILFAAVWSASAFWRDHARRWLMLGTLPVIVGLLCYHDPGFMQFGYFRYSLDFLPIWLAVAAPWTRGGWRSWATVACTAWSAWYFSMIDFD